MPFMRKYSAKLLLLFAFLGILGTFSGYLIPRLCDYVVGMAQAAQESRLNTIETDLRALRLENSNRLIRIETKLDSQATDIGLIKSAVMR